MKPTASTEKHCVCDAPANDLTLLQCDGCDKWYHPGCVEKGQWPAKTYANSPDWARKRDVSSYKGKSFMCLTCEPAQPKLKRDSTMQAGKTESMASSKVSVKASDGETVDLSLIHI